MSDPIPNLLDKYGGVPALKPVLTDFTQRMLVSPSIRRCLEGLSNEQIVEFNYAMFAFVLGKPVTAYDFSGVRSVLMRNRVTQHAYEEIVRLLRHAMLDAGFLSRDASIAINVLDMHAEMIVGVSTGRQVSSPFAGVDRRRVARKPKSETPPNPRSPEPV